MTQLPNTDADGDAHQMENGVVDEKQPLNNGLADKVHIIENADQTDSVHLPRSDLQKTSKRKYKTYDNGKRNRINLAPLAASGIRFEKTLKEKTGLTRSGLILAILCALLGITLTVLIILWPCERAQSVCVKASCLRLSSEIMPKLSVNESACSNFRSFACGNWFASKPLPKYHSEWNLKASMLRKYREKVHEALMRKVLSRHDYSWLTKMKIFYDSCMEVEDTEPYNMPLTWILKKFTSLYGDWKSINARLHFHEILSKMLSEYNVSPYFRIDVAPDPKNASQNAIFLRPPVLDLPESFYNEDGNSVVVNAYKRYIKDVILRSFDLTSVEATRYTTQFFGYECRIASCLTLRKENKTQPHYTRMKMSEINQKLSQIQLYTILSSTLTTATMETIVIVEDMSYFSELNDLIATSETASISRYLLWREMREVAEYVPIASKTYMEISNAFKKEIYDQHEPMPRWEFCISTLEKYMGLGMMALFQNETSIVDEKGTESVVKQIFSETSSIVKKNLMKVKFSESQHSSINKLSQMRIQIGLPAYMLQSQYLDRYYGDLITDADSFLRNIEHGINFAHQALSKKLKNPRVEDSWLDDMISMPTAVTFNAAANYVIVPWSLLQEPYFHKDYPLTSLYGGIGTEMAKAFIKSVTPDSSEEDKKKYLLMVAECVLEKDFSNLTVADKAEFIVTMAGLKSSYECLMDELSSGEHSRPPVMESYTNGALFFIHYVQSVCAVKTDRRIQYEISSGETLNDYVLSNSILSELPEFTELYSCNQGTKHSNTECSV